MKRPTTSSGDGSAWTIDALCEKRDALKQYISAARGSVAEPTDWYQYDILANLDHIDKLLDGDYRDLSKLVGGLPVADIGAADGDLAFALEHELGCEVDIIDTAATNHNGLEGARRLARELQSNVDIHDIDLDSQFRLPREEYGLVIFLGILYHLQNPLYALRALSDSSQFCLMSTRVARFAGQEYRPIGELPVAYLVGPNELNNDPTNFWIFSPEGLRRAVERTGWRTLSEISLGATETSTPDSNSHDERMFMLLASRRALARNA